MTLISCESTLNLVCVPQWWFWSITFIALGIGWVFGVLTRRI